MYRVCEREREKEWVGEFEYIGLSDTLFTAVRHCRAALAAAGGAGAWGVR